MQEKTERKRHNIGYSIKINQEFKEFFLKIKKVDLPIENVLYEDEIWDGPLTGICLWSGEKYYFSNIAEFDISENPRKYFLIRLTEQQLENDEALHNDFIKYIESKPRVQYGNVIEREGAEWDKYFEACEKYPDQIIHKDQIVAWFEW